MGSPRESWLKSDDPVEYGVAMGLCEGGDPLACAQDGHCKSAKCFADSPRRRNPDNKRDRIAAAERAVVDAVHWHYTARTPHDRTTCTICTAYSDLLAAKEG